MPSSLEPGDSVAAPQGAFRPGFYYFVSNLKGVSSKEQANSHTLNDLTLDAMVTVRVLSRPLAGGVDVGLTDEGSILVEGNNSPDVDLIQRPSCQPRGVGCFSEALAYMLTLPAGNPRFHGILMKKEEILNQIGFL